MDIAALTENWALFAAAIPVAIVAYAVLSQLDRNSPRGQLGAVLRGHEDALRGCTRAEKDRQRAEQRLRRMASRADRIRPSALQEARENLEDAGALLKIARDRLMVAENQVRRVIFEEFPPARHESLRARYLPQDVANKRPFAF